MLNGHDKKNHGGITATKTIVDPNNIYWINMMYDIKTYLLNCSTCAKVKKYQKQEKSLSKTILSRGPRDRYVADLWALPHELNSKNTQYRYVLDIIDHFTKFTASYLLNSKEALEIFPYIKNFMKNFGFPKYLITDNGKEFKNKILKEFCISNNVIFIHGLPYCPHSQGVVERVHRIIKFGLLCYKEDLGDKYNINYALNEVIENKNNIRCRITKKTPNELFNDEFIDNNEISRINNLMLESQKNSNIYKNIYEVGEKILINNNFKIDKKTIKKIIKN